MQNDKKTIMILGAGEIQVPVIRKSVKEGYYTIVVDYNPKAPGFHYANKKLFISTHDKVEILKAAKKYNIDGILTTSDFPVRSVAYVAENLGLNALNVKSSLISTDKILLRKALQNTSLNSPKYEPILSIDDIKKINFYPVVVKPKDSSGSRGVKKINNESELYNYYNEAIHFSPSKTLLAEQFISGNEYSIEAITVNGQTHIIAVTEKSKIGHNDEYFVEFSHIIPAKINSLEIDLINKTVKELVKVIGLNNSASHTEIIISAGKVFIVEIGARLGGDFITSDLVPLSVGVDMLKNVIELSVRGRLQLNVSKNEVVGIQFILPQNYVGAKKFIETTNDIYRYDLKTYKNVKVCNSSDRLGYIILKSKSRNDLNFLFDKINGNN